jgi:acyl-CoA thioester hydrolase
MNHRAPDDAQATMDISGIVPDVRGEARVRVPFHDCDPANVVWHGHYYKYFELARCVLLERIGYDYDDMARSGFVWPIVDTRARFVKPVRFNQDIIARAVLREWELRLVIDYDIVDDAGTEYTRATTTQVPLHTDSLELYLGTPQVLVDRIRAWFAAGGARR